MAKARAKCDDLLCRLDLEEPYIAGNIYSGLLYAEREFLDISNYREYDLKARELYRAAGSSFVLVWHGSLHGPTAYLGGNVDEASEILNGAWNYATSIGGEFSPLAAMPALLLAEVLYEYNEIDRVNTLLERYLPLSERIGFIDQIIAGIITQSKVLFREGQSARARSVLQHGEQFAIAHNFHRLRVAVLAELVRQASIEGDKKSAKESISNMERVLGREELKPGNESRTTHAMAALAWCRYLRLSGEYAESIAMAKTWGRFCQLRNIEKYALQFSATQITSHQAQGEQRVAQRLLHQLLERTQGRKFVNSFLGDGPTVEGMLVSFVAAQSETGSSLTDHAMTILSSAGLETTKLVEVRIDSDEPIEALEKQEIALLKMIDAGQSNKEIARQLNLTEGTVKWHMQNIYNKLGVRRRGKAAKLAKDIGLLGP